jgi:hypothetical protein
MELELTNCPECEHPAEIVHRTVLQSTDGPVDHVKVRCITGHILLLPTEDLTRGPRRPVHAEVLRRQR